MRGPTLFHSPHSPLHNPYYNLLIFSSPEKSTGCPQQKWQNANESNFAIIVMIGTFQAINVINITSFR